MIITYSEPKYNLGRLGKGLITSLGLKAKARPNKHKKASYAILNFSMKKLSKIIREFDKLPYKSYERRMPKHDPTDSYFYLARQLEKCMMRDDALNSHVYPVITEMAGMKHVLITHVCSMDESKSEEFIVGRNLSQVCSTDKDESKLLSSMKFLRRKSNQNASTKT